MRTLRRLLPLFALLALASCGGGPDASGGGGGDDPNPAKAMPANVAVYIEGTVRPEGDSAKAIDALAAKFGVPDPGQKIVGALERQAREEDEPVSYAKDIAPWLGRRAGVGLTEPAGDDPPFFGVVGVSDPEKAKAFVKKMGTGKPQTYKGTTYWLDDDTYGGVAGDYVVLSDDERQFRRVVDQIDSGKGSLAADDRYGDATDDLPDDRVGTSYIDGQALLPFALDQQNLVAKDLGPFAEKVYGSIESVVAAVTPHEDRAVVEIRSTSKPGSKAAGLFKSFNRPPGIVKEAPADALGVYGLADVGKSADGVLELVAGGVGAPYLKARARSEFGIDLDADVFSWVGDAAVFVRGTGPADLNGAVMIDATDEQAAAKALSKLVGIATQRVGLPLRPRRFDGADQAWETRLPGRSQRAYVARSGTRVVIGYGEEAARMALQPSSSLDANGSYDRAKQALDGFDPTAVFDAQKLVALAERYDGDDPTLRKVKPYLEPLAQLVIGGSNDGDTQTQRIAITVG